MQQFLARWSLAAIALAPALGLAQDVTGAGASFPAPVYAKWADAYNKATGARINYQSVGSGAGMNQIRAKTVDFGASDALEIEIDRDLSTTIARGNQPRAICGC